MNQAVSWQEHNVKIIFSSTFWTEILFSLQDYTEDAVEHLILASVAYLILCITLYVMITKQKVIKFNKDVESCHRVLLVTAHPDDECMFFGPTVLNFVNRKDCLVYLMCLSSGTFHVYVDLSPQAKLCHINHYIS